MCIFDENIGIRLYVLEREREREVPSIDTPPNPPSDWRHNFPLTQAISSYAVKQLECSEVVNMSSF